MDTTQAEKLKALIQKFKSPENFYKLWGQMVAQKAAANARSKGGRSFWDELARAVSVSWGPDEAIVYIKGDDRARQGAHKQYGGEIRPKQAKALAIPIDDMVKGKRPAEMAVNNLFIAPKSASGDTAGVLGYSTGGKFRPLFVLRKKVTQQPDPWWPTEKEVEALGTATARAEFSW